ncbi:MAG: hypothetical protein KBE22_16555 [Candidatus Accumulibacter sp.]|nr:hypothetical protein [Accumulibacter sp.]
MSELYLQLDVPPVLTGAPIPTTVNLRLTDLETQVGLTGSLDPLTVENRLTVAQADIITAQNTADTHIADMANPHVVTATQIGLGNCDDTSDADKPVSTLQAVAIADALVAFPVQQVAGTLTTQLVGITHTAAGTPDYAMQTMVAGGFGFVTADEAHTLLAVVKNLQTRLAEVEVNLIDSGLIA